MGNEGTVQKLLEIKGERGREKGRLRLRWVDGVKLDLRNISVKNGETKLLTDQWTFVVREAKAKLKGCSAQEDEGKHWTEKCFHVF
jgi:hypothetical protein